MRATIEVVRGRTKYVRVIGSEQPWRRAHRGRTGRKYVRVIGRLASHFGIESVGKRFQRSERGVRRSVFRELRWIGAGIHRANYVRSIASRQKPAEGPSR